MELCVVALQQCVQHSQGRPDQEAEGASAALGHELAGGSHAMASIPGGGGGGGGGRG